jgi:hypothetical protein
MDDYRIVYAVAGDVMLLASLVVLGGEFWNKLQSLFVHKAVALLPDPPAK